MRRLIVALVVAVAAGAAALTSLALGGTALPSATGAQLYYGKTSKGMSAQIDIRGQLFTRHSQIEGVLIHTCPPTMPCLKKQWPTAIIPLNDYRDIRFAGSRLTYHRSSNGGRANWWLEARRTQGGSVIAGWVRQEGHPAGYAPADSGKVTFTTKLWAATSGVDWAGKTADGRPLTMSVRYQPQSAAARFPFTVSKLSRPLTCRAPGVAASTFQVTVPELEGVMVGGAFFSDPKYQSPGHTPTDKPARGAVTTADGVSARATMTVSKLSPQGSGLVATGTLTLTGTATGDTGDYPCDPTSSTFTLRPR